jgi:ADP-ribose pyrophosphatase YjhB (NUDIX family)
MPMSPHVAALRAVLGPRLLHLPSVAVLCHDAEGRVLLVRESDSGRWSTPGGAIEPGEVPEEAAVREVAEETGLEVVLDRVRAVVGGPEYRKTYANGDELSYISIVYDGHVVGGDPVPDLDETTEVRWVPLGELALLPKESFLALLMRDGVVGTPGGSGQTEHTTPIGHS